MSIALMTAAWALEIPSTDKLVLLALADNANDAGCCWPSMATIARKCGLKERATRIAMRRLEQAGHVSSIDRSGTSRLYTVHPGTKCPPASNAPRHDVPVTPASDAPKPSRTIIPQKTSSSSVKRARKAAPPPMLDPLWIVPDDWRAWATDKRPHWPPGRVDDEADRFADYWRVDPNNRARKTSDWPAAWRQWCSNSERFDNERSGPSSSGRPARGAGRGSVTDAVVSAFDRVSLEGQPIFE